MKVQDGKHNSVLEFDRYGLSTLSHGGSWVVLESTDASSAAKQAAGSKRGLPRSAVPSDKSPYSTRFAKFTTCDTEW
jgi:hypothetical protein